MSKTYSQYVFHNYRKKKPPVAGWYVWRLPHQFIDDLVLIFLAQQREHESGGERVLSPEFDYWTGYRLTLPKGSVEWAEYEGEPPRPGDELLEVVGVQNQACPFCKSEPKWRYSGRYIGSGPTDTLYYYLECCHWFDGFGSRMQNPIELAKERNAVLSA